MDVLGLTASAINAGVRTQSALRTETARLASGLRINTAADDPSGLAIAESLASRVAGIDQGVHELQNANNALNVAEGAMASISHILQRMRTLVVQARSDLQSTANRNDMQSELTQLRLEIDNIAQNTSFNGRALLDGSASSALPQPPRILLAHNDGLASGQNVIDTIVDPSSPYFAPTSPQLAQLLTIDSFDPVTNALNITVTIGSQEAVFGPEQVAQAQIGAGTDFPVGGSAPVAPVPTFTQVDGSFNPVLGFNVGTMSAADVGKTALIVSLPGEQKAPGASLHVDSGDAEGSIITVDIPGLSSVNLGVNEVILGNDLQNQAAEYRIDYALGTLGAARAVIGAQTVSLQEAANGGNVASVNMKASESAIRDLNIGEAVTSFTRDQIQVEFQTRLVADAETLSRSFASLVSDSAVRAAAPRAA
ncbi:MAG TPA: flagellin [Candidatus Elarobacter sp.]